MFLYIHGLARLSGPCGGILRRQLPGHTYITMPRRGGQLPGGGWFSKTTASWAPDTMPRGGGGSFLAGDDIRRRQLHGHYVTIQQIEPNWSLPYRIVSVPLLRDARPRAQNRAAKASAARNWTNSVSQTTVTTFAFSFEFILLLWEGDSFLLNKVVP